MTPACIQDALIDSYVEELAAANETKLRVQNHLRCVDQSGNCVSKRGCIILCYRRLEQKLKTEQKEKELLQKSLEVSHGLLLLHHATVIIIYYFAGEETRSGQGGEITPGET